VKGPAFREINDNTICFYLSTTYGTHLMNPYALID